MTASTESYTDVLARLHAAQKPSAGVPLYLRAVNRPLGGRLAALGVVVGATPNTMTGISAALSAAGIVLLAALPPSWPLGVAVAAALLAGYAFDSADGQLARLRGGGSAGGEWLDHVVDAVKTCLLHSAVLVAVHLREPAAPLALLLVPLLFLTAAITIAFGTMLRDQLLRGRPRAAAPDSALRSALLLPVDHGTLCLTFLLLGHWTAFLVAYTVLAVLNGLFALRNMRRCYVALTATPEAD